MLPTESVKRRMFMKYAVTRSSTVLLAIIRETKGSSGARAIVAASVARAVMIPNRCLVQSCQVIAKAGECIGLHLHRVAASARADARYEDLVQGRGMLRDDPGPETGRLARDLLGRAAADRGPLVA